MYANHIVAVFFWVSSRSVTSNDVRRSNKGRQSDCVESWTTFITVTENTKLSNKQREKKESIPEVTNLDQNNENYVSINILFIFNVP